MNDLKGDTNMKSINLAGEWQMQSLCGTYDIKGTVPGTFFLALEESGFWGEKDVFWRENNRKCNEIARRDFKFSRDFTVTKEYLEEHTWINLEADGLDTLCEITINGQKAGATENMHRRYQFDVTKLLKEGKNSIVILFRNTLEYIEKRQAERYIWSISDAPIGGFNRIRKCSSSFGWDWGPQIPDLGIWRDLKLAAYSSARLISTEVRQIHKNPASPVVLKLKAETELKGNSTRNIRYTLTSPSGVSQIVEAAPEDWASLTIEEPLLWWPNGFGDQALYSLKTEILAEETVLDAEEQTIGLRTVELENETDQWGQSFGFRVNGVTIFAMGGNIIPQDVYNNRIEPRKNSPSSGELRPGQLQLHQGVGGRHIPR